MRSRRARILLGLAVGAATLGIVAAFAMFGPPRLAEELAKPEFCVRCHVMKPQYDAFKAGSHANLESCNECHLPNDSFVRHWFWDGVVGVRDLVEFNLDIIPEHITARERSRDWIEANCRTCHDDVISGIHVSDQTRCWECHRAMYHDTVLRLEGKEPRPLWPKE